MTSFKSKSRRKKYASGKRAKAVCDRSGFEHPYREMVIEPGTGLLVHRSMSDGRYNRVDHPQNFPADVGEAIGLKNPRPSRTEPEVNFLRNEEGDIILVDGSPVFME